MSPTLFEPAERARIEERLRALRPDSARQWGRLDAPGMLAHCALAVEAANGDFPMKQKWFGKILGPFFRGALLGPKPFSRNAPTAPELIAAHPAPFEQERSRLLGAVEKFCDAGPAAAERYPHGFLGTLTGEEWGRILHKHLDHHLRQFGA